MNKEYRQRLFALMDEIDDLAKMGIHLEKEEVTGEVEMLQEPEKVFAADGLSVCTGSVL